MDENKILARCEEVFNTQKKGDVMGALHLFRLLILDAIEDHEETTGTAGEYKEKEYERNAEQKERGTERGTEDRNF